MSRPCGLLQAQPDRPTYDLPIFSFLSGSSDYSTVPPDLTRIVHPCLIRLYIFQSHFRTALTSRMVYFPECGIGIPQVCYQFVVPWLKLRSVHCGDLNCSH
ncbi:hypothetical protein CDAR_540171 [Caerostris darwini]|uniref:Uncharacterized protein n=1 Tax=Caerostris darwini TaxID=1538125 RepID=A0AAV4WRI0_9ARAC|nr:hypothetical protein CDAR_540171 [Caerostris darwini]